MNCLSCKFLVAVFFATTLLNHSATAQNLCTVIDAQPNFAVGRIPNFEATDPTGFSSYFVNRVTISQDTVIDSVSVYCTNVNNTWTDVTEAILNIFDGDDLTTVDDPRFGGDFGPGLLNVTVTEIANNMLEIKADGLNLTLEAGVYQFGLTPSLDTEVLGVETQFGSSTVGGDVFLRNLDGVLGFGTDWFLAEPAFNNFPYAAMTIRNSVLSNCPEFTLTDYSARRGNEIEGGIERFQSSDDSRARFQPGFTLNNTEAPVWLEFEGEASAVVQGASFGIEMNAGTPGVQLTVELWNSTTNEFEVAGVAQVNFNADQIVSFPLTPDQIDVLKSRVGFRKIAPCINFPWELRVDHAFWSGF